MFCHVDRPHIGTRYNKTIKNQLLYQDNTTTHHNKTVKQRGINKSIKQPLMKGTHKLIGSNPRLTLWLGEVHACIKKGILV